MAPMVSMVSMAQQVTSRLASSQGMLCSTTATVDSLQPLCWLLPCTHAACVHREQHANWCCAGPRGFTGLTGGTGSSGAVGGTGGTGK